MLNVKNTILDSLLSVIAPHLCSGCGQIGRAFCDNCKYDITTEAFMGCVLCGEVAFSGICDRHIVAFNQAWVVGTRSGPLQRLIGGFKFRNMQASVHDLADLLNRTLPTLPSSVIFVPIPTTPAHIRERGYDHMLIVTKKLGSLRHLPVLQVLRRNNTLIQHRASRQDRIRQATTAFRIDGSIDPDSTYILVDDVVTTGSTITQAAHLLKNAGAQNIWVAVTSRQPLD